MFKFCRGAYPSHHRDSIPSIDVVGVRTAAGRSRFVRLAHFPGFSRIRCMNERFVGFALLNEISIPCLVEWKTGFVVKLRAQPDRDVSNVQHLPLIRLTVCAGRLRSYGDSW